MASILINALHFTESLISHNTTHTPLSISNQSSKQNAVHSTVSIKIIVFTEITHQSINQIVRFIQ